MGEISDSEGRLGNIEGSLIDEVESCLGCQMHSLVSLLPDETRGVNEIYFSGLGSGTTRGRADDLSFGEELTLVGARNLRDRLPGEFFGNRWEVGERG